MPAELPTSPIDPREKKRYYIRPTFVRRMVVPILRGLFWLVAHLQVEGVENLPTQGAVIVVANHLSTFDVFPLQFALPRPIFFMAKAELHANPLFDALLRQLGSFPVYRGSGDTWAMRHAARVLEKGQVLGIFPEGTRSKKHQLATARSGAARLAIATGYPIVPVALNGTQRILARFPHRCLVTVRVGTPILPAADILPLELTDRMMFALAEMLPEEMRGVYARHPEGF